MHRRIVHILLFAGIFAFDCMGKDARRILQNIGDLSNPEPAVRARCYEELKMLGETIRPELQKASLSSDPAIRSGASSLLDEMVIFTPNDSPFAKDVLQGYAKLTQGEKYAALQTLGRSKDSKDISTLLQVLLKESNSTLVWDIANNAEINNPDFATALLRLDAATLSLPLKNATAIILLQSDHSKGIERLREVVKEAEKMPITDQLGYIPASALAQDDIDRHNWQEALHHLRLNREWTDDPMGHARVLVIQAQYGPLPGLMNDLKYLYGKPDNYVLSILLNRIGCTLPAHILAEQAHSIIEHSYPNQNPTQSNKDTADFLNKIGQPHLAAKEIP